MDVNYGISWTTLTSSHDMYGNETFASKTRSSFLGCIFTYTTVLKLAVVMFSLLIHPFPFPLPFSFLFLISFPVCFSQQRSAARADAEGDDEDDMKAQEDQEFLETLQESKDRNGGEDLTSA